MEDILGKSLRRQTEIVDLTSVLQEHESSLEFMAIYFGAHWAPPCRMFTLALSDFYSKINKSTKRLEVVFCSIDGNEAAFERNYATMPFLAIPYTDEQRI